MGVPGMPKSALQLMAPELARGGYLNGQLKGQVALFPEIEARVARAVGLYVNQALHPAATLIAALHPRAVEYLEQAPILALAATRSEEHTSELQSLMRISYAV